MFAYLQSFFQSYKTKHLITEHYKDRHLFGSAARAYESLFRERLGRHRASYTVRYGYGFDGGGSIQRERTAVKRT